RPAPPPEGFTAPLAYVPSRIDPNADEMFTRPKTGEYEGDVCGKLVVTEGFGMPGKVAHFEELGAVGLIAVNSGRNPHWGICTTIWGTPDLRDLPRRPKSVVVAVNHVDGQALIAAAQRGEPATVVAQVEEGWYVSPIPVVTIRGTEEPEPFVLLHGHYDSW